MFDSSGSADLVGAHYDVMGTVSIQGVPWLVGEYEAYR